MLYERDHLPGAWEYIRNYSKYQQDAYPAPIVHRVALKATMLSSRRELEAAKASADLYLNPPVGGFDLLAWERFDELVELGYRYAREQLADWVKEHPELVHHQAVTDVRLRTVNA
jgi:predicted acylesterase/phospholipase RssA